METNLRPLSLGEILDRTAQLYRTNFLLFAGIAAPYAGVALLINLVSVTIPEIFRSSRFALGTWPMQVFSWSSILLMLLVSNVAGAANNRAVAWVHLGEPSTVAGAYRSILPRMWRYLGLGALKLLVAWTPLLLLYGGFQAAFIHFQLKGVVPPPGQVPPPGAPPNPQTVIFGLISIGIFVVMWPLLIYAVFMALRYALALPVSVVENLPIRAAIKRSISLTKGVRSRILVLWLLVGVIQFMVMAVTQAFFVAYSFKHHYQLPLGLRVAQQVIAFFTNSAIGPILAIGTTLFYYDQRIRKEGYDIEWMMAAAGMAEATVQEAGAEVESAHNVETPGIAAGLQPAPDALSPGDSV